MEVKDELWVQNLGTSDVSVSDLQIKVPAGKTVNVFQVNPRLTAAEVHVSLESGALCKRINDHKVLRIVNTKPKPLPLQKLKEETVVISAKKTKTSVIVEAKNREEVEGSGFEFADYGVEVGGAVSQQVEDKAVVVRQKEDPYEPPVEGSALAPKTSAGPAQRQTEVLMEIHAKSASHPMGKVAETAVTPNESQPFVVSKPPVAEPAVIEMPAELPKLVKQEDGSIAVAGVETTTRSLSSDDDDDAIIDEADFDTKVATTKDGAIVMMELKEEPAEETVTEEIKAEPEVQ